MKDGNGYRHFQKSFKMIFHYKLNRERTFFAHEMLKNSKVIHRMLKALTQNVYITINLDVFDPSIMPSTGTPEPGGLDWYTLLKLIESVIREKKSPCTNTPFSSQ